MDTTITIETPRLILRPFKEADWQYVHAYGGDAKVCEFLEWGPNTISETKEFVRRSIQTTRQHPRLGYEFAMEDKTNGRVLGSIGIYLHEPKQLQAVTGWTLAADSWGRGFATEAAKAILEFGFAKLKLHRISAMCDANNIASFRVMEKCGMRREGHFLQDKFVKGRWRDTLAYSILSHEWNQGVKDHKTLPPPNQIDS